MSYDLSGIIPFIPLFWITSIFLLIKMALRRIQPDDKLADWQFKTQLRNIRPRPNLVTLLKIYTTLRKSTPREMAIHIRDELTGNAALAYDKPNSFFVKHRSDTKVMKKYFRDDELLHFFGDPKRWAQYNGAITSKFFGFVQTENEPSEEFYENIARVIGKFEKELAGVSSNKLNNDL